jgi:protoporphyrinogen oxidase
VVIYRRNATRATSWTDPNVRVAVIGGGLAGLGAALDLSEAGADVVVLEAGDRFGGQVRTTRERGFLVEEGADGFAPEQAGLFGLVRDLRLDEDVVAPESLPRLILDPNGRLQAEGCQPRAVPAATLRGGMAKLVQALARRLERKADLRVGNATVALARAVPGWTIYPELGAALVVDAIVLAVPARPAAWLIHPLSPPAARSLAALGTRPLVTVAAAYSRSTVRHPLRASGFAVARDTSDDGLDQCGFVSSVFRGRAPADWVLLRTVMRPARGELVNTTDEGWARAVHAILSPALGLREAPAASWVARWADAIPVVDADYTERIAQARNELQNLGRIELAGAAYDGEGLEGALLSGRAAARRLLAS